VGVGSDKRLLGWRGGMTRFSKPSARGASRSTGGSYRTELGGAAKVVDNGIPIAVVEISESIRRQLLMERCKFDTIVSREYMQRDVGMEKVTRTHCNKCFKSFETRGARWANERVSIPLFSAETGTPDDEAFDCFLFSVVFWHISFSFCLGQGPEGLTHFLRQWIRSRRCVAGRTARTVRL